MLSTFQAVDKSFSHNKLFWRFLDEVERPRIVCARTAPMGTTDNLFGQVVVRMYIKQVKQTCYCTSCCLGLCIQKPLSIAR